MSPQRCIACFTTYENTKNVSLFKFPTDETRREIWIKKLELSGYVIPKTARVCSKHFSIESFTVCGMKRKQLHPNAVPLSHEEVMNYLERNGENLNENVPSCSSTSTALTEVYEICIPVKQTGNVDNAVSMAVSRIQMQLNKQKPSTSSAR